MNSTSIENWPKPTLSLRDWFAGMAMQGLLSAVYSSKEMLNEFMGKDKGIEAISRNATSYADALIAELDKE
jgi:hypothetical protein